MNEKLEKMGNQELAAIWASLGEDDKFEWNGVVLYRRVLADRKKRNVLVVQVYEEMSRRGVAMLLTHL